MDLSMIQTHLDNFVDTWEGWGKILGNVGSFFQNRFFRVRKRPEHLRNPDRSARSDC